MLPHPFDRRAPCCAALVALALAGAAAGQPLDPDFLRSRVSLELAACTPAAAAAGGSFAERSAGLHATVLFAGSVDPARAVPLVQPFLSVDARAARADLPWTPETHDLLRAGLGGGVALGSSGRELYLLGGAASWDADGAVPGSGVVRGTAYGMGTLRLGEDLRGLYGLVFGYAFGQGLLLPALGVRWAIAPGWSLLAILPFELRLAREVSPELRVALVVQAAGDRAEVASGGAFPGSADALALGTRSLELGLSARLRSGAGLQLEALAGARTRGRLFAEDGSARVFDTALGAGGFLKLRAGFDFGPAPLEP